MSHINYHIINWGGNTSKILSLQKKAIRSVHNVWRGAHAFPLFVDSEILSVEDLHKVALTKFYMNYLNDKLPHYFNNLNICSNSDKQSRVYMTRHRNDLAIPKGLANDLDVRICKHINSLPEDIKYCISHYSERKVIAKLKQHYLKEYPLICTTKNCYSCKGPRRG